MNKSILFLLLWVSIFVSTGCFSISTLHTARPIEKGSTDISVHPQVLGVVTDVPDSTIDENGNITEDDLGFIVPNVEAQFRHGFTDRFDMGIKLFIPGVGMDFNILLVNKPKFALSIDPSFTAMYFASEGTSLFISTLWLPVLFDVLTTKHVTITLGPKPGLLIVGGSIDDGDDSVYSDSAVDGFMGGVGAVKFQITNSFYIMPEFNGIWQFKGEIFWWSGIVSFGFTV